MQTHRTNAGERACLVAGIAFAVLQLLAMVAFSAFVLPKLGDPGAPPVERAAAFAAHATQVRWANYLLVLPMPLFLLFLGGLYSAMARLEGGRALAAAGVLAGASAAMLWPLAAVISDIGVAIAEQGGDPVVVAALDGIGPYTLSLTALTRVVMLGTVCAVLLTRGVLAGWIPWLGIVAAALNLIGTATLVQAAVFPALALGTLLFEIWLIAFCVALLRRGREGHVELRPLAGSALHA